MMLKKHELLVLRFKKVTFFCY